MWPALPLAYFCVAKLTHMVGEGGTSNALIPLHAVDVNTKFGAYANKFTHEPITAA